MKFPDKSVLCLWRKSESMLWHFACMPFPGSACLLLRNEHRECEQADKYFIMLGILTFESLYVFTLNFLKPHHLVSFFPLLLANIFFFFLPQWSTVSKLETFMINLKVSVLLQTEFCHQLLQSIQRNPRRKQKRILSLCSLRSKI